MPEVTSDSFKKYCELCDIYFRFIYEDYIMDDIYGMMFMGKEKILKHGYKRVLENV